MNKKVIAAIVLVFILISLPLTVYLVKRQQEIRKKAVPATTLSLLVQRLFAPSPGEEFSLAVLIDTGENQVAAADVTLSFEADKLVVTSVTQGSFLTKALVDGDISPGRVRFAYYDQPPKQGGGTLATVNFKVQEEAPAASARIDFDPSTIVGGVGEKGSVLAQTSPAVVTILAAPTPSPTNTPTPEPATPTPTPTVDDGTGGLAAPTEAPTEAPTPTPTEEELPVAGSFFPTLMLLAIGGFFILAFLFVL